MFNEDIKVVKRGKRLHINYFQGAIIVEDLQTDADAYEYCLTQARTLAMLRNNLLREAEKFNINE